MAAGTLPAMGTTGARSRPVLVVERKGDGHFEESQHPRDRHGRFISIGAHIDLGGGHKGEVTHVSAGEVTVKRDDGKTVTVAGDALKNAAVTHGPSDAARAAADASAPHAAAPRTRPSLHASAPDAAAPSTSQLADLGIDERALRAIDKKLAKKNEQIASAQNANRMSLTRSQRELKLEDDLRALQEERGQITKGHMVIWNERRGAYQVAKRPGQQDATPTKPDKETPGGTTAKPDPQRDGSPAGGSSGTPDVAGRSGGDRPAGRTVSRGVPALKPGQEVLAPQLIQLAPGERVLRDGSGNDYLLRQGGQLVKVDRSGSQPRLVQGYALPHQLEDATPSKGVFSVDGSPVPARLGRLENPDAPLKLDFQPSTGGLGMSTIPMDRPSDEEFNSKYRQAVEAYRDIRVGPAWNKALREDGEPQDTTGSVDKVRELINGSTLQASVVTFRGGVFPEMEPGTVIHDKGFMSLTVNPRIAKEFALNAHGTAQGNGRASIFTLALPEGTKVGNLMRDDVGELVLPPGSAVRIKSKKRTGTFNNYEVELVPAGAPSDTRTPDATPAPDVATPTVNVFHGGRYGGMQYIDVASNSEEIQQQIEQVFGFEDPKTGLRTKWDYEDSRTGLDKLELHGTIVDRDGNRVGTIERSATLHDDGRVEVHDDLLRLDKEHQGQGFEDALHRHTLTTYPLIGVEPTAPESDAPGTPPETTAAPTKAQQLAAKNKWKLPTGTLAELQAQLDAVKREPTPSAADLIDQGMSAEDAAKKAKRLYYATYDRAYRQRVTVQAAIDTLVAAKFKVDAQRMAGGLT